VVAARADALLGTDADDPVARLLTWRERVRLGGSAQPLVTDVAATAVAVAKAARRPLAWDVGAALEAATEVLARAGEPVAAADVRRMTARLGVTAPAPDEAPEGVRRLAWLEQRLLRVVDRGVDLVPGFPAAWAGQGVEVYGAMTGGVTVGFALRWHGERPALLWELSAPVTLTCRRLDPAWSANEVRGEALLAPYR
jgi:hypothetical protein